MKIEAWTSLVTCSRSHSPVGPWPSDSKARVPSIKPRCLSLEASALLCVLGRVTHLLCVLGRQTLTRALSTWQSTLKAALAVPSSDSLRLSRLFGYGLACLWLATQMGKGILSALCSTPIVRVRKYMSNEQAGYISTYC